MSGSYETSTQDKLSEAPGIVLRAEVLLLFWTVTPGVRFLGFFRTARLFKRIAGLTRISGLAKLSKASPIDLCQLVETQTTNPLALPTQCMTHAIALQFLLEQHGHPSEIRLGVQNLIGGLRAHAWVESSGQELASNPVGCRYVPITNA